MAALLSIMVEILFAAFSVKAVLIAIQKSNKINDLLFNFIVQGMGNDWA